MCIFRLGWSTNLFRREGVWQDDSEKGYESIDERGGAKKSNEKLFLKMEEMTTKNQIITKRHKF